ncbi:MmcQ/YjbR family DNA-binding protein [Actinoplanes sp. NPDC049681]|uniref:MmcQ/YjbR family DNA-binding protein n=1 Tax=Actinoplanes sp. NPDC049681 TaxID=3363905 RepID=UPI0037BDFA9D
MAVTWADLREWVLALPGGQEAYVENWGDWTLRCGAKMFVVGRPDASTCTVKASKEDQAELIGAAPDVYSAAPYVGRFGWVKVELAAADPEELRQVVVEAWRRTAPKKLLKEYDSAQGQGDQG